MTSDTQPPPQIIEQYDLDPDSIQRLTGGLINRSFSARRRDNSECVLQRVNSIFPATVNDNIDAVTRHLDEKGLATPLLIRSQNGSHHVSCDGEIWRLLTRIEGETFEDLPGDAAASEASRILGSFHQALSNFNRPLLNSRPPVHNLERHLGNLRQTLDAREQHQARAEVADIGQQIVGMSEELSTPPVSADRLVHGDPKISNVIFSAGRAICLIDLDTVTRIPVAVELGDALRSWCNPAGEDSADAHFSLPRFRLALEGYRLGAPGFLAEDEWRAIPDAALSIALELAARFAADALNESYFAWDPERFETASEHNRTRARAQLGLAKHIQQQLPAMHDIVVTLI